MHFGCQIPACFALSLEGGVRCIGREPGSRHCIGDGAHGRCVLGCRRRYERLWLVTVRWINRWPWIGHRNAPGPDHSIGSVAFRRYQPLSNRLVVGWHRLKRHRSWGPGSVDRTQASHQHGFVDRDPEKRGEHPDHQQLAVHCSRVICTDHAASVSACPRIGWQQRAAVTAAYSFFHPLDAAIPLLLCAATG